MGTTHAWILAEKPDETRTRRLADALDLPAPIARLLCRRGIEDPELAGRFLDPDLTHLPDPMALRGMEAAVERILRAIDAREPILVHGDYDVDGTTATALLVRVLGGMGACVDFFIPNRAGDGYGVSARAVDEAARNGVRLVVTCDCGISDFESIARAREKGIDVIVTDHHEIKERLPDALAVINPKREDCAYPFDALAGVGVAFKLASALVAARARGEEPLLEENLDLVALGTIADVVPLVEENRVFARLGLRLLNNPTKPGVMALIERAGLAGRPIEASSVAFWLAPRINAAGRVGDASRVVALMLSSDPKECAALAEGLESDNRERRRIDVAIYDEIVGSIDARGEAPRDEPIVLWSDRWHPGVLGIVASKLVERYRVPALLVAMDGTSGRGSGRSVPGFDLVAALAREDDLLEEWGGHRYAAGVRVRSDRIEAFRDRFVAAAMPALARIDRRPVLSIEEELRLESLDRDLTELVRRLEPFGYENEEPVYSASGLQLAEAPKRAGEHGQHLRITAYQDGFTAECIGFGMGEWAERIGHPGQRFAIAFVPELRRYHGRESVQLRLRDVRPE